MTKLSW